tara:strand:- start:163 stop:906 length:744 start_codon:yes stop_codon:yes gene_type:complete
MKKIIAKKRWGQNFLIDKNICKKIVKSIDMNNIDEILEIGPGTGSITELLAEKIQKITAIEIDPGLCQILKDKNIKNLKIINRDILKIDLTNLEHKLIIGNLPYYITTPIIFNFLNSKMPWEEMYFLMQKEVADRIVATPGTKTYGRLTIMSQIFCTVERLFNVSPNVFRPIPKVESTFVKFKKSAKYNINNYSRFQNIIRTIFNKRRKKLKNCINDDMKLNFSENSNLLNKRPEQISIQEYVELIN